MTNREAPGCFMSDCYTIYLMNADGTQQTRLASGRDLPPAWAPNGSKIAFGRGYQLYTINPDGSEETMLTHGTQNGSVEWFVWSPDSSKLAVVRGSPASGDAIYLTDANSGAETFLTNGDTPDWQPLVRSAFKNAADFCRAQREAIGQDVFRQRYGTKKKGFRNCVRQNH